MSLSTKTIALFAGIVVMILGLFWIYESGYSDGKLSIQKQVDDLNSKAVMLQKQVDDKTTKTEIEYVYKDRIIYKKRDTLIGKVDAELKNESRDCRIGPAFIRLYNLSVDPN